MPTPYKFSVVVDGKRCSGTWTLKQGCRVHVSCGGWGVETVDCAPSQRPEEVVAKTAERIIRAYRKAREAERKRAEREIARVNRYWDGRKKPMRKPETDGA